jgi:5'-deoxynucleotidase YfbR-like HD superfamily hydrolase
MATEGDPAIDFLGVHTAFAESEYGAILAANVRYDKYRPPEVSKERWEELLGPDVNNLDHLFDTYQITNIFIAHTERLQPGLLVPHDRAVLRVAAIIHDWGESIVPDVNYTEKTEADEITERQAFAANLQNFYTGDDETIRELIVEAADTVIFDRESRLGSMFNVIERIGYLQTGLRADQHAREATAPDCEDNLRWLTADVLSNNHTTSLIVQSPRLLAIQHFLDFRQVDITEAFDASLDPVIFTSRESEEFAARRVQGIREANLAWKAWCVGREFSVY